MKVPRPSLTDALPFALSFTAVPFLVIGAVQGGWWLALVLIYGWYLLPIADQIIGRNVENLNPNAPDDTLHWYRMITLAWVPIQLIIIFGMIWYATRADHLGWGEKIALFAGVGVLTGSIGINFAHELMHQKHRLDRWCADILLASVLYSHFRSEHLIVHHIHVGTPRDTVTAPYNEGFWSFFARVLPGGIRSSLMAEAERLQKKGKSEWDKSNPFWLYAALQLACLSLAFALGGLWGVVLFATQAFVAIWQLALVNYVEHYGLPRKHLGDGKYEPTRTYHSWNATHTASNWLLINLQRHADHHTKPSRRFPLLQAGGEDEGPQLPYGYPVMTAAAMIPPLWRRRMNPRVRAWRRRYYPEITDWTPYNAGTNPLPR